MNVADTPRNACLIEMHAPYDKHHTVSLLVKSHQSTRHSVKDELLCERHKTQPNIKCYLSNTCIYFWT